ncbi:MAG: NADH-quinone oxidoreductase subunit M [Thermoguttaceae bacterium]
MSLLLMIALLLPLLGVVLIGGGMRRSRIVALAFALATFAVAAVLAACSPRGGEPFAVTDWAWFGDAATLDIRWSVGLDGLSLWLFALTSLLMVVAVLVSWESIREQTTLYYRLLLVLETGMLGVFVARDIILFYVFFEFTLIPLFFVIGIWGSDQRRRAAMKFFLYTLAGSVLTLLGLLSLVVWTFYHPASGQTAGRLTFSIPELTRSLQARPMDLNVQLWVFWALFAGFAIKSPLFPLHTWLPLAHVEAPAAGSVLLAGVLLKVGVYGFARFSLPMLPEAAWLLMPWLLGIAMVGIIYGALVALAQQDLKRLIAYSSVSHMGFCMLGLFAMNPLSVAGGVLQMVNHGLATGGLFAVVGMLYERYHTRQMADLGGLARRMPWLAMFAMVLTLSSIGVPGLNGFVGEFLILAGTLQRCWTAALSGHATYYHAVGVLGVLGVILGAWYMLNMYRRVFFGPVREPEHVEPPVRDLSPREICCFVPLVVLIVWIGVQPGFFLDRIGMENRGATRGKREVQASFSLGGRDETRIHPSSFDSLMPP